MSWDAVKKLKTPMDRTNRAAGISESNTLVNVLDPFSRRRSDLRDGAPDTLRTNIHGAGDPGNFFHDPNPEPTPLAPRQRVAPSIDEARQAMNQSDRVRRRRGALANIYAGSSNARRNTSQTVLG